MQRDVLLSWRLPGRCLFGNHLNTRKSGWTDIRMNTDNTCMGRGSEEHTSELQSLTNLVCRLLLEKKKKKIIIIMIILSSQP